MQSHNYSIIQEITKNVSLRRVLSFCVTLIQCLQLPAPAGCWELGYPVVAVSGPNAQVVGEQHIRLVGIEGIHMGAGHRKTPAIHQTMEAQRWIRPIHSVDLVPLLASSVR